jgi:hypothetical protein
MIQGIPFFFFLFTQPGPLKIRELDPFQECDSTHFSRRALSVGKQHKYLPIGQSHSALHLKGKQYNFASLHFLGSAKISFVRLTRLMS